MVEFYVGMLYKDPFVQFEININYYKYSMFPEFKYLILYSLL